jgi:integrase
VANVRRLTSSFLIVEMQLSALALFGSQRLRRIAPEDIARFNGILRERGCSPSTRAKHLRVLGACLQAAVSYRYADSNPVRELPPAQRPRPERKEAAYFENDELPRLFAHFQNEPYRTLCMAGLKDGDAAGRTTRPPLE